MNDRRERVLMLIQQEKRQYLLLQNYDYGFWMCFE